MLDLTEVNLLNSSKKTTNSDIKTTPIPILEKSPLSDTRNLNTYKTCTSIKSSLPSSYEGQSIITKTSPQEQRNL